MPNHPMLYDNYICRWHDTLIYIKKESAVVIKGISYCPKCLSEGYKKRLRVRFNNSTYRKKENENKDSQQKLIIT